MSNKREILQKHMRKYIKTNLANMLIKLQTHIHMFINESTTQRKPPSDSVYQYLMFIYKRDIYTDTHTYFQIFTCIIYRHIYIYT